MMLHGPEPEGASANTETIQFRMTRRVKTQHPKESLFGRMIKVETPAIAETPGPGFLGVDSGPVKRKIGKVCAKHGARRQRRATSRPETFLRTQTRGMGGSGCRRESRSFPLTPSWSRRMQTRSVPCSSLLKTFLKEGKHAFVSCRC